MRNNKFKILFILSFFCLANTLCTQTNNIEVGSPLPDFSGWGSKSEDLKEAIEKLEEIGCNIEKKSEWSGPPWGTVIVQKPSAGN